LRFLIEVVNVSAPSSISGFVHYLHSRLLNKEGLPVVSNLNVSTMACGVIIPSAGKAKRKL
jgi:hypothetical protein